MSAYYNEFDPKAAAWLRELIKQGHIAKGIVDERSIEDVTPSELKGFTQCHFFAGVGVWSYALRRAGWPDDRQIWTGSCPCQPFSAAGKGDGFDDERHLWPAFHHLIAQCRPPIVVGEQVASKAVDAWIDLVHADLEAVGYAFGSVPFPSAGVGAPHIRDRNYWVADSNEQQRDGGWNAGATGRGEFADDGAIGGMENSQLPAQPRLGLVGGAAVREQEAGGLARTNVAGGLCAVSGSAGMLCGEESGGMGYTERATSKQRCESTMLGGRSDNTEQDGLGCGIDATPATGPTNGFWRDADWLFCRDGKWRPVEPGTSPLAHGTAARVGRLRGYGNAINAEAATAFIESYQQSLTQIK